MRVLAVVLSCLLLATAIAGARPGPRSARQHRDKQHRDKQTRRIAPEAGTDGAAGTRPRVATATSVPVADPQPIDPYADSADPDDGAAPDDEETAPAPIRAPTPPRSIRGQSIGSPWSGRLQDATRLQIGDGTFLRRPQRAFGTKTTVDYVRRAVRATLAAFPKTHVLAIGDLSAERGGWISEHASHRSGRDIDLGLFYKRKPAGYPESFVRATDDNLDRAATWALLANLLDSHGKDGGVQMIFLDYDVQGLLYRWAQGSGVGPKILDQIFQYPHGRGTSYGIVHHEPNHDNHLHVRFRCAKADADCY
jgi:hypothetical protein